MRNNLFLLAFLFVFGLSPAANAHDGVHVANAYAHETPPGAAAAAVFLQIISPEATHDDVLIAASTPRAEKAELHSMTMDEKGVMKMRALDRLPIVKRETVDLTPDGTHIMLLGLKDPLKAGEEFPLTLTFEHEGAVEVKVPVKAMGDSAPMDHHGH